MSSQTAMSLLSVVEFCFWAVLGSVFWSKKLHRRFPAMGGYLGLRIVSTPLLLLFLHGQAQHWFNGYSPYAYFLTYWSVYVVGTVLLYFISLQVFRSILSPYTGLKKLGMIAFRWAFYISVVSTFASVSFPHRGVDIAPELASAFMRPVSIVELCLLGFICLSMNALQLSTRDLSFGISLGLGIFAANDFMLSLLFSNHTSLTAPIQFLYQSVTLVGLLTLTAYVALPERARKPVVISASSTVYRWNEIASALGHTGTKVAVQQPATSFFLTDVERVVERVIARNMKGSEMNS
jgi:hypothetical protein